MANPGSTANPLLVVIDQPFTNPDSVVNPLYDTFIREGKTELSTWDTKISGTVIELFGMPVSGAAGTEVRYETYSDWRPPFHGLNPAGFVINAPGIQANDNDFIGLSPNLNLNSNRNILSGYAEVLLPVVDKRNRMPLVHLLEFSAAGRYERYSDFGDTFKPKYSVAWKPDDNLLLRASYNESFRAPNLVQTNTQPLQRSVSGVSDPYRFTVTSDITDGSVSRTVFRVGNESLQPEEAETVTVGMALEVPRIKGFTITVDWFNLKQTQVIDNLTATGQLSRDQQLLDALVQEAIAGGASANSLDLGSGTASYQGNTKVNRAAVTQADRDAFALYNSTRPTSSHRAPVGRVLSVVDDYINIANREVEGYDMAVTYRTPKSRLGTFTLRSGATYTRKFDQQADEFSETETVLEEDGRARWRANASINWRRDKWSAGWFTEYYGGSMDIGGATTEAVYEALGRPSYIRVFNDVGDVIRYRWWIEETIQHNAYVEHRFGGSKDNLLKDVTLRLGVTNVFDEEPSLADESRGYQGGTISAKGRSFYGVVTKRF
jgi:outer membrane receptor protein involved in Fe transport